MPHTHCSLGNAVSDTTNHMYYRGQRIKEAYYRGEKIWGGNEFLGIYVARFPYKTHYPGEDALSKIDVARLPDKVEYVLEDEFDYSGAVINAIYKNGGIEDVTADSSFTSISEQLLSGEEAFNADRRYSPDEPIDYSGAQIVGLWSDGSVEDVTDECVFYPTEGTLISVGEAKALLGIVVVRLPNKASYRPDERFELSGVRVNAVYADLSVVDITPKCVFDPLSGATINFPSLIGIIVTELPKKTIYADNENLDLAGVKVVAVYTNGHLADVTSQCSFTI